MERVASFQIFIRDNRPRMNAYYPFLSQEQIFSRLKQQWKKLDVSKRQMYCKLVIAKPKTIRVIKVKATRLRSPRKKKANCGTLKKAGDFCINSVGMDSLCDDDSSFMATNYECDSPGKNSPFMKNKLAIDNLNAVFHSDISGRPKSVNVHGVGRTYAGRVFELKHHVKPVSSEAAACNKVGILKTVKTPCKNRRTVRGNVSFSALEHSLNVHNSYQFLDEDIDEEVLYVENTKTAKENIYDDKRNENKASEQMVLQKVKLQVIHDYKPGHDCDHTPSVERNLPVRETPKTESNKRECSLQQAEDIISFTPVERTLVRFSKDGVSLAKSERTSSKFSKDGVSLAKSERALTRFRKDGVSLVNPEGTPNRFNKNDGSLGKSRRTPSRFSKIGVSLAMHERIPTTFSKDGVSLAKSERTPSKFRNNGASFAKPQGTPIRFRKDDASFAEPERTPSRFSKRLQDRVPNTNSKAAFANRNCMESGESLHNKLKQAADVKARPAFNNTNTSTLERKHQLLSLGSSTACVPSGLHNKLKGHKFHGKIKADVQVNIFSSSARKGLIQEHKLTGKHQNNASTNKFQETVKKHEVQNDKCTANLRITPSCQNTILGSAQSSRTSLCSGPAKKQEDFALHLDLRRCTKAFVGKGGRNKSHVHSEVGNSLYLENGTSAHSVNSNLEVDQDTSENHQGDFLSILPGKMTSESLHSNDADDLYLDNCNYYSETNDDDDTKDEDTFLSNMTDQTTSALLQAIERLTSLSSPWKNVPQERASDGRSSRFSGNGIHDNRGIPEQKESLCHMFQDIKQSKDRTFFTPAKQRLLSSSMTETPSNFMDMFDDREIFF